MPDLKEEFKYFTAATISSGGKVEKVYHDKREKPWVTGMKKEIFKKLQSKMYTGNRTEVDGLGQHNDHFK